MARAENMRDLAALLDRKEVGASDGRASLVGESMPLAKIWRRIRIDVSLPRIGGRFRRHDLRRLLARGLFAAREQGKHDHEPAHTTTVAHQAAGCFTSAIDHRWGTELIRPRFEIDTFRG